MDVFHTENLKWPSDHSHWYKQELKNLSHRWFYTLTAHWWQLDKRLLNGSSKYWRWIHSCSKSNLHLSHFNFTLSQSKHQRCREELLLLKISLLSLSEVVQLLRQNRGLSRAGRQEKVYLSSCWELSYSAVLHLSLCCSIRGGNSPICFPAGRISFGWMRRPQWSWQTVRFMRWLVECACLPVWVLSL